MDVPLKQTPFGSEISITFSFNPCFGGCSIKTHNGVLMPWVYLSFNPCFGGCSIKTVMDVPVSFVYGFVSILVLVDVPLKHSSINDKISFGFSFNPCFGGCSIKTVRFNSQRCCWNEFQSLFWWMFH